MGWRRPEAMGIAGTQLAIVPPSSLPGKGGKSSEILDASDVVWRESVRVEDSPVVRHVMVSLTDDESQAFLLIGCQLFRWKPLASLEEPAEAENANRIGKIANLEIN